MNRSHVGHSAKLQWLCSAGVALAKKSRHRRRTFHGAASQTCCSHVSFSKHSHLPNKPRSRHLQAGNGSGGFRSLYSDGVQGRGIEPLSIHFPSIEPSEIREIRASIRCSRRPTVNIPVDDSVELCRTNAATRDSGNARYRTWIDIAVTLRSPSIRIWIPKCTDTSDLPGPSMASTNPRVCDRKKYRHQP